MPSLPEDRDPYTPKGPAGPPALDYRDGQAVDAFIAAAPGLTPVEVGTGYRSIRLALLDAQDECRAANEALARIKPAVIARLVETVGNELVLLPDVTLRVSRDGNGIEARDLRGRRIK